MRSRYFLPVLVLLSAFALLVAQPAYADPTLYVESIVVPPGVQSNIRRTYPDTRAGTAMVFANAEVRDVYGICAFLIIRPITPGAPPPLDLQGFCGEYDRFHGPHPLSALGFTLPEEIPDDTLYELDLHLEEMHQDKKVNKGNLLVRRKPFFKGDVDDDGEVNVADALRSLHLATGMETPTPYTQAAGDADRDGQHTVADTLLILGWSVGRSTPLRPPSALYVRKVERGLFSGVVEPRTIVIQSSEAWSDFLREHDPSRLTLPPPVEFETEIAVALVMGSRPNAGYSVEATAARTDGGEITVFVRETRPPRGVEIPAQPTSPYQIIAVPRLVLPLRFETTTVQGRGVFGLPGGMDPGDGGPATSARLLQPIAVETDIEGNLYIVDWSDNRVRKVTPDGTITTIAGTGEMGYSGDGGPGDRAQLSQPSGVATDRAGNVYIADAQNHLIRRVSRDGIITTVAGSVTPEVNQYGEFIGSFSGDGGPATQARLNYPRDVAVDAAGNLYIADYLNARIRKVGTDGIIQTVVGGGMETGDALPASRARLSVVAIDVDRAGHLYLVDRENRVRKIGPDGIVRIIAGNGERDYGPPGAGGDGGTATDAYLAPSDVAVDVSGNVYIADSGNHRIRKVDTKGIIQTVAGAGFGYLSAEAGPALTMTLNNPSSLTLDGRGNVYIADTNNRRIRQLTTDGTLRTVAGSGVLPER